MKRFMQNDIHSLIWGTIIGDSLNVTHSNVDKYQDYGTWGYGVLVKYGYTYVINLFLERPQGSVLL